MVARRLFVIASCAVLFATSTNAQSGKPKASADPISGAWTGEFVLQKRASAVPVTMELKFDGKRVTGTVTGLPNPAEVKVGAFNAKTGTLNLQLGKKGEDAVLLVLEGALVKGTVTGRFSGEESGEFKITKKG